MGLNLDSVIKLSDAGEAPIDPITLFVALLCVCIVIGNLLEKNRWMNVSITALAIGLCTGIIILLTTKGKSSRSFLFNGNLFFIYLLPPIIFSAGFQMKKKRFFRNFITINVFGAVGTFISFSIISIGSAQIFKKFGLGSLDLGDYFALGAIFAATDSVCTLQVLNQEETPLLYSLVFGEGVVNDATSVVLFHAVQKFDLVPITSAMVIRFAGSFLYLFISSTLLGIAVGLMSAYVIKKLYFGRHSSNREVALMILMAYLSYMMAELCRLSGILSVFFCGIVMSHYTLHNLSESSRVTTKHVTRLFSFISETFIFLYVGMDALDIEKWNAVGKSPGTSIAVSSILFGLVMVGRAASIFPLSYLTNLAKKSPSDRIGFKQQVTIWWAGLMRGAVSVALAYNKFTTYGRSQVRDNDIIITSTITIVVFSNVVFGLLTKPLVRLMVQPNEEPGNMTSFELSSPRSLTIPFLSNGLDSGSDSGGTHIQRRSSLAMLLTKPTYTVHYHWRNFDNSFMRPIFGGSQNSHSNDLLQQY
ncbi:Sodium/hydrogen exchanger [Melia azedarach]|uniref:Sodium/hydrogen exchanger n=1 Tax=Melia azedarach TaxID=155640 RepID=A0ACC1YV19_MELAZ|nr:Sodium/hydrogen exchanger [Melia azedarach]